MRRALPVLVTLGLTASLVGAPALPWPDGPGLARPAAAADCPSSGGGTIAKASATGDVVFRGGGWGHGLGMSQYGAQGAALLGCSYRQILGRYYAGTAVVSRPMADLIRLRMLDGGYRVDVEAVQGTLRWELDGCVVDCPPTQPAGARWQLTVDPATGQYVLWDLGVIPKAQVWRGGGASQPLRLQQEGSVARVTTWRGASKYLDRWLRWDRTVFTLDGDRIDAVQHIGPSSVGSAMDKYLWGIAEVPASFPQAALKAQAVAARTYAAKRAGRILMPTPADQNYTGWRKETEGPGEVWGSRWKAAVDATSGKVIALRSSGALIDAFYSSSMGGHTEDERYVWGLEAPWLRAVDDSRWDLASSNPPQNRSWAVGLSWGRLASALGFTEISDISVPPRGAPARVNGVRVTGLRGGAVVTTYVEGWDVREALDLLSPGFTVRYRRGGGPAGQPLAGDWDGDGDDEPGWFKAGTVALSMTTGGAAWTKRFRFGRAGDVAVVGDWDGDGVDDVGVFRAGRWLLRDSHSGGPPTARFTFGRRGDRPVVGSWNGTSLGVGVVRGNRWLLRFTVGGGPADRSFRFGRATDVPVVGSWSGAARTGIGVERNGTWLLRHKRSAGSPALRVHFGRAADRALTGDWDGDGRTGLAAVRGSRFHLRESASADAPSTTRRFRG